MSRGVGLHILKPQSPLTRWWQMCSLMGLFVACLVAGNAFLAGDRAVTRSMLGQDFLAFYTAASMVRDGHVDQLYDLQSARAFQQPIAAQAGLGLGDSVAPWWNPPHVALLFRPLAGFSFSTALTIWTAFNLACLAIACAVLIRILPDQRWQARAAVPLGIAVAYPTIQFLGHGQNTGLSVLLMSLLAMAWLGRQPLTTGAVCALLMYKPQLAAVLAGVAALTLGWRVLLGMFVGGLPLLLATMTLMPDALFQFFQLVPVNLREIQFQQPYLWDRHVTLLASWRLLFQGMSVGPHTWLVQAAYAASATGVGWCLLRTLRAVPSDLNRIIGLTIAMTPVLMPFYFDYDLLVLAVAAVCLAGSPNVAPRRLMAVGCLTLIVSMVNAPLAAATHVNAMVLLLVASVPVLGRIAPAATADRKVRMTDDVTPSRRAA